MKLSYLETVINNTPENRRALPENISLVEIREAKSPCRFETKLASYVKASFKLTRLANLQAGKRRSQEFVVEKKQISIEEIHSTRVVLFTNIRVRLVIIRVFN